MSYLYNDIFSTELHAAIQLYDLVLENKKSVGKITLRRNVVTKELLISARAIQFSIQEREFLEILKINREFNTELYNLVFIEHVEDLI